MCKDFYGFHLGNMVAMATWTHLYILMLGKSPKVSRKNLFPFQRYLSKTTKEGEKHPPPPLQSLALQD